MSMKTAIPTSALRFADPSASIAASRVSGFVALTKPRIAVMVLFSTAVGYVLGARGGAHPATLAFVMLGTGLVAAGASAWNQILERNRDSLMRRTARRPLPSGLVAPGEASLFAALLSLAGVATLYATTTPMAAVVAAATLLLYVGVYTPLKPITTLNTAVGAIPGALPPVIGWAAATGGLGIEALSLFLILFLWQFPHFFAIAWVHREDYARGGHRMLPSIDPDGRITASQSLAFALVLVPAGLLPTVAGLAGGYYFAGSLALGLMYAWASAKFLAHRDDTSARGLMRASFVYLPLILVLLLLNPMPA